MNTSNEKNVKTVGSTAKKVKSFFQCMTQIL